MPLTPLSNLVSHWSRTFPKFFFLIPTPHARVMAFLLSSLSILLFIFTYISLSFTLFIHTYLQLYNNTLQYNTLPHYSLAFHYIPSSHPSIHRSIAKHTRKPKTHPFLCRRNQFTHIYAYLAIHLPYFTNASYKNRSDIGDRIGIN